jgi:HK97 gp10 family phage protein
MSLSVQFAVKGLDSLQKSIAKHVREKKKARMRALTKAAYLVRADAQQLITRGPKTGRVYGKHQASAPGQPPANDTGNLVRSITVDPVTEEEMVTVTCRAPYAAALELGTDDGKIKERPFMRPAANRNKKAVSELMKEAHRGK